MTMRHTHMGRPVRFPKGAAPGDRIGFRDDTRVCALGGHESPDCSDQCNDAGSGQTRPQGQRSGIVLDRAANGVGDGCESQGYWLWVMPDDDGEPVRVRYYASGKREGQAWRDDGPMWVRSGVGRDEIHQDGHRFDASEWLRGRGRVRGPCLCHGEETRTA